MTDLRWLVVVGLQAVLLFAQFTNDEIQSQYTSCGKEINMSDSDITRLLEATKKHRITIGEQEAFRLAKPHERQEILDEKNRAAEVDKRAALGQRFYAFEKCMMTLSESVVGKD
ncbi:uncharacterized protein LOC100903150 [Galendromus occidentalis]|uniref:Uncharacterized protein LOC100903150 n=1 Tax=Galendromus occidentalis TaxID=34638 RepID=A0AAJ6QMM2_9ACAR|nr:uncharacterized protein LOC100903150 [Galendromus occidentalis]